MRKFLIKVGLFFVPILLLVFWTIKNYVVDTGDLRRMAYLNIEYDYKTIFKNEFTNFHEVIYNDSSLVRKKKWKFFTIGDSFTQQSRIGYVNKLSAKFPNEVVSYRHAYQHEGDVFSTIYGLAKSDYFDSINVEYVVLQHVERYIVYKSYNPNKDLKINHSDILNKKKETETANLKAHLHQSKEVFPTDRFVKFPLNNLLYSTNPSGHNGQVFKEKLSKPLFSTKSQDLLFFKEDFDLLPFTNEPKHIKILNDNLNEIAQLLSLKGVKLIVLIAPDKLDVYYPYILNKDKYTKPNFFEQLDSLPKDYLYVESRKVFRKALENDVKDLYLYDDTHWSPWGSEIIANEIANVAKTINH